MSAIPVELIYVVVFALPIAAVCLWEDYKDRKGGN